MFENVLVGVDGRPSGRDAVALAAQFTRSGGKLTLAHVRSGLLNPIHAATPGAVEEERAASDTLLEQERARAGVDAELVSIVDSSPGAGLHRQAEEMDADLLVVGTTSRGALGRAVLGDDTRAALNGAPCAVAIAAGGFADAPKPIATVGVAYNESPQSKVALEAARELARPTKARVRALEVVTVPSYTFSGPGTFAIGDTINTMVDAARARLAALDGVEGEAVYGLAGEELAAFSGQVDVLVVGSRGYGPVKRLVLGSTSDYLQRNARCSLLVLTRTDEDQAR